jgi:hypothetical protein
LGEEEDELLQSSYNKEDRSIGSMSGQISGVMQLKHDGPRS